jgi:hypothetical protein
MVEITCQLNGPAQVDVVPAWPGKTQARPWERARLLIVSRDPGPKTVDGKGSGFLCWENVPVLASNLRCGVRVLLRYRPCYQPERACPHQKVTTAQCP